MAETAAWAGAAARSRDVSAMQYVEQILRGHQQRSASSGRQPRLSEGVNIQGHMRPSAAAGSVPHSSGDAASGHGRSPRPRSVSVDRRQVRELMNVMEELQSTGRRLQNIGSSLDPPGGLFGARSPRSSVGTGVAPAPAGVPGSGIATGGASSVDGRVAGTVTGALAITSSNGGNNAPGGPGSVAGASRGRSAANNAAGQGSGKPAQVPLTMKTILNVQSLASKLEYLEDRLTPRKSAARDRDASANRRYPGAGSDAANGVDFRELLAEANAGLLTQGHHGLLDTVQGSRDQRPITAAGPTGSGHTANLGSSAASLRGHTTATTTGSIYGGKGGSELVTSAILQNRHLDSEDIRAAERRLQKVHAEIRGTSAGGAANGTATEGPAASTGPAAAAPPGSRPASRNGLADMVESNSVPTDPAGKSAARVQLWLASLSEVIPPPQTPSMVVPDPTPARPVVPPPQLQQHSQLNVRGSYDAQHSSGAAGPHPEPRIEVERSETGRPQRLYHVQNHPSHGQQPMQPVPPQHPHPRQQHSGAAPPAHVGHNGGGPGAQQQHAERSAAGSASLSTSLFIVELGQRLSLLDRGTEILRGVTALEPESSSASGAPNIGAGPTGHSIEAWHAGAGRWERREGYTQGPRAADGVACGSSGAQQAGARSIGPWADGVAAAVAIAATSGSGPRASITGTAGAVAGVVAARLTGPTADGGQRELVSYALLPSTGSQGEGSQAITTQPSWAESEGLNVAFLKHQRNKERARREEQEAAGAAIAASRDRHLLAESQARHDKLMTQLLAARQRVETLEAEQTRIAREGCHGCTRRREQMQQLSDVAANNAAQLKELQAQLQDARMREDMLRRQLEHTSSSASDQAAAAARQRTSFELMLQEFLELAEEAAAATRLPGAGNSGALTQGAGDMEALSETLRLRLKEQGELVRRQREMLEDMKSQLAAGNSAANSARESAALDRALSMTKREVEFQRERAAGLEEEVGRQREMIGKKDVQVKQLMDELDRAKRQRDAAEISLQSQQVQLEAAKQQQDTLMERLYDGQRAKEDAESLQAQIRSLGRQLEEARAAAARSGVLERKAESEREAREELDAQLAALQSQVAERDSALEASKRRVRELEAAANSAVASRQVALDQISSRADEVRTLTSENARMFHLLDRLQQEKRAADTEIQSLSAQVATLQQDTATLRSELATAREQLTAAKTNSTVMDATLAQHHLSTDLASARSEAAALRAAHEAAGEYAQSMARTLRRHGLAVPEPPTAAEVASQIGALQTKLSAESDALAAARSDASELRQQLNDARVEIERLKREHQSLSERYGQLEAAHAASQQSWELAADRDAATIQDLSRERDALQLELHTLRVAGTQDADEMRRKVNRMEVQVEALTGSKREAEERARQLAQDLGALRKALAENEAQMEAMRLTLEDAREATERAELAQRMAEKQAADADKARSAALADAEKARAAAHADKARAAAAVEAERARAAGEAEKARAAVQAVAEVEKAREEAERRAAEAAMEVEKAREDVKRLEAESALGADKAREEAERRAAEAVAQVEEVRAAAEVERQKQVAEVEKLQDDVERLQQELDNRNAEYAGLYDYCAGEIGLKDAAIAERDQFAAAVEAVNAEVEALRQEVEALREDLADKEQKLAVKPKMAELQYRINELSAQLADVTVERDTAVAEATQTAQKLQDETESHFQTDGRRVRLGEEVERLRGILRMYSIPF